MKAVALGASSGLVSGEASNGRAVGWAPQSSRQRRHDGTQQSFSGSDASQALSICKDDFKKISELYGSWYDARVKRSQSTLCKGIHLTLSRRTQATRPLVYIGA